MSFRHKECIPIGRCDKFKFLNRSVPIFPEKEVISKPNEQKLIKVKAPFVDEISGMAIIKILDEVPIAPY